MTFLSHCVWTNESWVGVSCRVSQDSAACGWEALRRDVIWVLKSTQQIHRSCFNWSHAQWKNPLPRPPRSTDNHIFYLYLYLFTCIYYLLLLYFFKLKISLFFWFHFFLFFLVQMFHFIRIKHQKNALSSFHYYCYFYKSGFGSRRVCNIRCRSAARVKQELWNEREALISCAAALMLFMADSNTLSMSCVPDFKTVYAFHMKLKYSDLSSTSAPWTHHREEEKGCAEAVSAGVMSLFWYFWASLRVVTGSITSSMKNSESELTAITPIISGGQGHFTIWLWAVVIVVVVTVTAEASFEMFPVKLLWALIGAFRWSWRRVSWFLTFCDWSERKV